MLLQWVSSSEKKRVDDERAGGSVLFRGATPLAMQPDQNSQGAEFNWTGWNQVQAKYASKMYRRLIRTPHHSAGSDQTSKALFGGNAKEFALTLGLGGRGNRHVHRFLGHIQIAFAASVPARIVILTKFFHSAYIVTKISGGADYRRECQVTEVPVLACFWPLSRHNE